MFQKKKFKRFLTHLPLIDQLRNPHQSACRSSEWKTMMSFSVSPDQRSLHFHIPYNNTCTFLITADNQPGGIKRGIKSQKLFDLRGHTSSGLQTDAVGGEINEAIGSCSDGPRLYCAAFRSGAWLYYLNRRAGQKKKIVILWSETPQCCVRPLKWTSQAGGSEQVCGGSSRFHQSGGSSTTSSPLTSLHSLCRLRRCAPYFSVAVQSSSN